MTDRKDSPMNKASQGNMITLPKMSIKLRAIETCLTDNIRMGVCLQCMVMVTLDLCDTT